MSRLNIQENVALAPYTTLGIGGPARFFTRITEESQIPEALDFARARSCPVFILGGGSNILVADTGFPGLVLKIELRGIHTIDDEHRGIIVAAAGETWDVFVQHCIDRDLAGIECLSGIPGTVGAAPVQNIGAYGQEICKRIISTRVLDREIEAPIELSNAQCKFSYRSSIFNTEYPDRYIILKVAFDLHTHGRPRISHPEIQSRLSGSGSRPSLREVRQAVLEIRRAKGMIVSENDPDSKSAGSFFKNPVLTGEEAERIEAQARARGLLSGSESIPRFPFGTNKVKLAAGWLVERAGFPRGYTRGNAAISTKHALALINRGGATAQEILDLMHIIQDGVREKFGVMLEPEPVIVGI